MQKVPSSIPNIKDLSWGSGKDLSWSPWRSAICQGSRKNWARFPRKASGNFPTAITGVRRGNRIRITAEKKALKIPYHQPWFCSKLHAPAHATFSKSKMFTGDAHACVECMFVLTGPLAAWYAFIITTLFIVRVWDQKKCWEFLNQSILRTFLYAIAELTQARLHVLYQLAQFPWISPRICFSI